MTYNEESTAGPCGRCGARHTVSVCLIFPVQVQGCPTIDTSPFVLATCAGCGAVTRDIFQVVEAATGPMGIYGPLLPAGYVPYGEEGCYAAIS